MILKIHLQNFRCYKDIWFPNEISYQQITQNWKHIFGPNGSGKTSILEAISLLNAGGLRSANPAMLGYHGDEWTLLFQLLDRELILKPGKFSRSFFDSTGEKDWRKLIIILWATPQYIAKFCSSKTERKLFIDKIISHENKSYRDSLRKYNFYYKSWNIACKNNYPIEILRNFEANLLTLDTELKALREVWITKLKPIMTFKNAQFVYSTLDNLEKYRINCQIPGFHTGDLLIFSSTELKYLSTGEQKILFISFLYSILLSSHSKYKFLLLDDWYDNLDSQNQFYIKEAIYEFQFIEVWSSGVCKIS